MAQSTPPAATGFAGRARATSISLMKASPQLGMWQATGTAIAQAPNLVELREPDSGGSNIAFDAHGHSARIAKPDRDGGLVLVRSLTRPVKIDERAELDLQPSLESSLQTKSLQTSSLEPKHSHKKHHGVRIRTLHEKHKSDVKEKWGSTILNGLKAFWKFFLTPSGFFIVLYAVNVVAWGAMLFFLLLKAAPAMNHPSADDDSSPRKKWIEIDSQILNALFCVTGFGLAPWRFRDFYWMIKVRHFHDHKSMAHLMVQNKGWFRPAAEYDDIGCAKETATFTGQRAPPTALWKLVFVIDMMVLNTALQAVLSYFMWGYNRIDRPSWATGTFIALGCGTALLAGLMSWWEGRKVKKIEGPEIVVVQV